MGSDVILWHVISTCSLEYIQYLSLIPVSVEVESQVVMGNGSRHQTIEERPAQAVLEPTMRPPLIRISTFW